MHKTLERRYHGEHPFRTLLHFYSGDVTKLFLAVVYFLIKHSGVWAMPLITANIIDVITNPTEHPLSDLWFYALILLVIFLQNVPMHTLYAHTLSKATRNMEWRLRSAMTRHLQQLSMDFYHRNNTGALQSKLLRDVEIIQELTRQLFETVPMAMFTILFAIIVTGIRVPQFLVFFVLTVPAAVLLYNGLRKALAQRNKDFRYEVEHMSSSLIQMLTLMPITRAHAVETTEIKRIEGKLERVRETGLKLDLINALFGAAAWVTFKLFDTVCLIVAAYLVYTKTIEMTVGDVILLTGFFSNLTNAVLLVTGIVPQITKGFESVRSIGEILESPDLEHNEGRQKVTNVHGDFVLEQVSFMFPDSDEHMLRNLSLQVEAGETIAIVGASGAGKSTLLNLLIGFIRPTSGRILLDGRSMADLDLRTYRRFLSVIPQETVLLEGTIRENILYGTDGADEIRLQQVIHDANLHEFIEHLPLGIDTEIGENGAMLSGGQRQRIAIARALIRNPRVLIMDEATSALDVRTERLIQEALDRLTHNRTTFIVAHRLSTIRGADRIIVMEDGQIVEVGTHEALIAQQGHYARLNATQVI